MIALLLLAAPLPLLEGKASFDPRWLAPAKGTPARIATLAPSVTEVVFRLGGGGSVVAVSSFDDFPPEVTKLPKVGGFLDPNVEAIVHAKPDLVIAAPNASNRRALERVASFGVPVLIVPGNSLADLVVATRAIAAALGREAEGEVMLASIEGELESIAKRAKARPKARAVFVIDQRPLVLGGPGSLPGALLALLGFENVCPVDDEYAKVSLEALVSAKPGWIVDTTHGATEASWDSVVALLPAKPKIVHTTDMALLRAGPRIGEALGRLAAQVDAR